MPLEWVEESSKSLINSNVISDNYGLHWWITDNYSYSAVGYSGQWIMVFPGLDMVVVFNNNFTNSSQWDIPERLVREYIIPSIN